jgi:hypothetical protein
MALYVISAAALLAVTIWIIVRYVKSDRAYSAALLLPLSLLLYPATEWHYTPVLLVPLCLLWSRRNALPYGSGLAFAVTFLEFMLAATGNGPMFASLLMWVLLVLLSAAAIPAASRVPAAPAFATLAPQHTPESPS